MNCSVYIYFRILGLNFIIISSSFYLRSIHLGLLYAIQSHHWQTGFEVLADDF